MVSYRAIFLATMIMGIAVTAFQARAGTYYATYVGTASGVDTNGIFGVPGSILINTPYTSVYTYDPSLFGNAVVNNTSFQAQIYGGSRFGRTDPLLSAAITIGGVTFDQSSTFFGSQLVSSRQFVYSEADSSPSDYLVNYDQVSSPAILSLTASQSFPVISNRQGSFQYQGENIALTDSQVTITDGPPTDIPEPSSLALLGGAAAVFASAIGVRRVTIRRNLPARSELEFA